MPAPEVVGAVTGVEISWKSTDNTSPMAPSCSSAFTFFASRECRALSVTVTDRPVRAAASTMAWHCTSSVHIGFSVRASNAEVERADDVLGVRGIDRGDNHGVGA